MAVSTIIFRDDEDKDVQVGINLALGDDNDEMTNATYNAALVAYIIEKGYYKQYEAEFRKSLY